MQYLSDSTRLRYPEAHAHPVIEINDGEEWVAIKEKFPWAVYSGSKVVDGPRRIWALCSSEEQARALVEKMWQGVGYWEKW